MAEFRAPGLRGDWLNAWLAALGVLRLVEPARLRWSEDVVPVAVFTVETQQSLPEVVAAALPSLTALDGLAIASLPQNPQLKEYTAAVTTARGEPTSTLAMRVTDLALSDRDLPAHGRFDVPAPRGETLWTRLRACRAALGEGQFLVERLDLSLRGMGSRIKGNGLGFDFRRIVAGAHADADLYVDPVVETLAFFGLMLFPVRGDGREARTRGWIDDGRRSSFHWFCWRPDLDIWGVDALIGAFRAGRHQAPALPLTQVFRTVPFRRRAEKDLTRGFATSRLA